MATSPSTIRACGRNPIVAYTRPSARSGDRLLWTLRRKAAEPDPGAFQLPPEFSAGAETEPEPAAASGPDGVFGFLVEAETDIVGMVAYAIYKREKRDWLHSWRAQNAGEPTPAQFDAFVAANLTAGQRERYREAARNALDAYRSGSRGMRTATEAAATRLDAAEQEIERLGRPSRLIVSGVLGAAAVAALLAAGVALVRARGYDYSGMLNALIPPLPK